MQHIKRDSNKVGFFGSFLPNVIGILFVALWVIVVGRNTTYGDGPQMLEPVRRLLDGDIGNVYPADSAATAMTGWFLIVAPFFALMRTFVLEYQAWIAAGMLAVPIFVAGVKMTLDSFVDDLSEWGKWGIIALLLMLPSTIANWTNYYHPQDVAATGMVLIAVVLLAKNKWSWASVLLGVAILTRQWTIFALVLSAPIMLNRYGTKQALKFVLLCAATVLLGLLPFLSSPGWFDAFSGSVTVGKAESILGRILIVTEKNPLLLRGVRLMPLASMCLLAAWMWRKKVTEWRWVLPALAAAIAFRIFFESAPFLYYWAPFMIFAILAVWSLVDRQSVRAKFTAVVVMFSFAVWVIPALLRKESFDLIRDPMDDLRNYLLAGTHVLCSVFAIVCTYFLVDQARQHTAPKNPEKKTKESTLVYVGAIAAFVFPLVIVSSSTFPDYSEQTLTVDHQAVKYLSYSTNAQVLGNAVGSPLQPGDIFPEILAQNQLGENVTLSNDGASKAVLVLSHWDTNSQTVVSTSPEVFPKGFYSLVVGSTDQKGNWPPSLWLVSSGWTGQTLLDNEQGLLSASLGQPAPATLVILDASNTVLATQTVKSYGEVSELIGRFGII